jgi:hypothetical protein
VVSPLIFEVAAGGDEVLFVGDKVVLDVKLPLATAEGDTLLTEIVCPTASLVALLLNDTSDIAEALRATLLCPLPGEAGIATGQNEN